MLRNGWLNPHPPRIFAPLVCPRVEAPELLDMGYGTLEHVQANLAEMWRINRFLGGTNALNRHLYPRLLAHPNTTLLDLGTGSAHIPVMISRWARAKQINLQIFAVDWAARNLAVAQTTSHSYPEIHLLQTDASHLPFSRDSVDFVISSLFLHHFAPDQVISLLASAFQSVRCALIMTDLVRGWLPYFGFKLIQPIFAHQFLTRHDGALSIRRAYTPVELRELADAAGLKTARVHAHHPWRMTLVADK